MDGFWRDHWYAYDRRPRSIIDDCTSKVYKGSASTLFGRGSGTGPASSSTQVTKTPPRLIRSTIIIVIGGPLHQRPNSAPLAM